MSDVNVAPDGAGSDAAVPVTLANDTGRDLSVTEAARALAAARHKPKEQAPVETVKAAPVEPELAEEANAAPEEPAHSEATTEAEPAVEQSPIEPPRSWTKEAKERWQSLPRETQEYLANREQERDREVRRSQNETAEKLKGLTAKEQAVEKARQEYEAKLPAIMQALQDAQAGVFSDIKTMDDVTRLAQEDPFRYLQWQAHQQKLQAVNHEMQKAEERKTQEQQTKWTEHVQKENQLFVEKISEADKPKLKELMAKAPAYLEDQGFTQQELTDLASGKERLSIYDHRIQSLILDGMKYQDAQKAKSAAVTKPVPPVQRPGVAKAGSPGKAQQIQDLEKQIPNLTGLAAIRAAAELTKLRRAS